MKKKEKECRGTGKTKGLGCGEMAVFRRYGLCPSCLGDFLFGSTQGVNILRKITDKAEMTVKKEKRAKEKREKRESNEKKAMKLADTYFSRYIRLVHSVDGQCTCYTCGTIKPIKEVDNGHYIKRVHKSTRYHENNCRPQCKTCNGDTLHNGKQTEFRINLVNEIGLTQVKAIENLSKESINANYFFYKEIADKYRIKVNELQKEFGVKYW